jgi:hypothetical protein
MIRKRYGEASGNWHIDVMVDGQWVEISEPGNEDEADGIIAILTTWLLSNSF